MRSLKLIKAKYIPIFVPSGEAVGEGRVAHRAHQVASSQRVQVTGLLLCYRYMAPTGLNVEPIEIREKEFY